VIRLVGGNVGGGGIDWLWCGFPMKTLPTSCGSASRIG